MRARAFLVICCLIADAILVMAMEEPFDYIPPRDPCKSEMKLCEFWLHVGAKLTMVHGKIMTQPSNGKIYSHDVSNFTDANALDMSDVITADGFSNSKMVFLVNGTLPGPTLEVYEGQIVVVHIINHLLNAAISMHFHGIHMKGSPWSDGVGFVTQCPILPGQRFTHKFKITQPGGTYWYHAHVGSQRTMGIFGAFIIKNRPRVGIREPDEHIVQLQDWNHDWDSSLSYFKMVYGMYEGTNKLGASDSLDGAHFSLFRYHSGLINGRGRYYDPNTPGMHNQAPLTVFKVKPGNKYRFRVIGVGSIFPFRFSIDNHSMMVVATDGYDIQPKLVESFIINPGERYDVIITTDQSLKNYWVRAQTLEVGKYHVAEAILNYEGVDAAHEPTSEKMVCTNLEPCVVLNCPFRYYPRDQHTKCISLDQLRGRQGDAPKAVGSTYKEFFLNFAFPGKGWTPGSVNGRAFLHPTISPLTQPKEMNWKCDPNKCGEEKVCSCAYNVKVEHGDTVQMVFTNLGSGKGWSHPMHLHGHSFYVTKIGFGNYNQTTGKLIGDNLDIDCRGNPDREKSYCNDATWANSSWRGDNLPGINLVRPVLKDTVMVPTGGYVVLRFKADNPGIWILHCHIEIHNMDGMAMLLRESPSKIPNPPAGFPTCRNFLFEEDIIKDYEEYYKPGPQKYQPHYHVGRH